ncbi:MAG TPA: hypothetical protein VIV84_10180 [Burkholderiaceae bacterium]
MILLPLVLKQLQQWDERRSGVPGEHWAAFGTGVALLQMSRPGRSAWLRAAAGIAGVLMIWRAASGRDGVLQQRRTMEQTPGPRIEDQREALEQSAKNATISEPQNFRDEANADKVVEIPPDKQNRPIQGMDPEDPDDRGRMAAKK